MMWHLYLWLMMSMAQPVAPNDPAQFHTWAVERFDHLKTLEYHKIQPAQEVGLSTSDSTNRRLPKNKAARSSVRRSVNANVSQYPGVDLETLRLWRRMERPANQPYRNFAEDQWP